MRKKSIVEDFKNKPYPGSLIMNETNNFMSSVLMDIDDEIRISYNYTKQDLQMSIVALESLYNVSYDTLKRDCIDIRIDERQSNFDNDKNTAWVLDFDSNKLLREYLYTEIYTLNPNSPFKEIPSNIINTDKLGDLCYEYIDKNVLNKYEIKEFLLWVQEYDLVLNTVPLTGVGSGILEEINPTINLLYKKPEFTFLAIPDKDVDKQKKSVTIKQNSNNNYTIGYKQNFSSQFKTFIFYYDVIYKRK